MTRPARGGRDCGMIKPGPGLPADSLPRTRRVGDLPLRPCPKVRRAQIFQELIQSKSFVPVGFIACLVDTTSTGVIVTKS